MSRPTGRSTLVAVDFGALREELTRSRAAPRRSPVPGASPRPTSRPSPRPRPQPNPQTSPAQRRPQDGDSRGGVATDAAHIGTGSSLDVTESVPDEPDFEAPDATVADLVARSQAGEAEAFGLLYDRYVDLVYRYIYYRVNNPNLAEDLVSETFLRALRRIDSFTWQGRDFAAWLVTIARNLIADHFKSGRYRLEITTEDILETGPTQTTDGPENLVLDALTNETLLIAVKKLNPEQQECIVLRFLQGLSVSETALAMGKNDGAIKALQYRAVRALARLLPEESIR
jgi:RNA polymerase sigma-70 factor (ECF subfamily)